METGLWTWRMDDGWMCRGQCLGTRVNFNLCLGGGRWMTHCAESHHIRPNILTANVIWHQVPTPEVYPPASGLSGKWWHFARLYSIKQRIKPPALRPVVAAAFPGAWLVRPNHQSAGVSQVRSGENCSLLSSTDHLCVFSFDSCVCRLCLRHFVRPPDASRVYFWNIFRHLVHFSCCFLHFVVSSVLCCLNLTL